VLVEVPAQNVTCFHCGKDTSVAHSCTARRASSTFEAWISMPWLVPLGPANHAKRRLRSVKRFRVQSC
jgi:hypothetical protein